MVADVVNLDALLALETKVWEALQRGDAEQDRALLSADFIGVYPTGFSDRTEHAQPLLDGPTVAAFELHEPRLMVLSDDHVLLCYRADWRRMRDGEPGDAESMYISSLWSRRDGDWVNVFSQDTPTTSARP
jgi:hypothetical protein